MGQTGSNMVKKIGSSIWGSTPSSPTGSEGSNALSWYGASPYVLTRRGSMYFDEDGDLAHEFYEEVVTGGSRPRTAMRRNKKNLTPQGEVQLPHPRLHMDFPVVLFEITNSWQDRPDLGIVDMRRKVEESESVCSSWCSSSKRKRLDL